MRYNYLMYNSKRTLEIFGYDLENNKRRSKDQVKIMGGRKPKDLDVIDNCPSCGIERTIKLNQSRKNKPCSKCFHNSPEMLKVKQNQNKVKSEETKQRMRENHWSKTGTIESPFKDHRHVRNTLKILKEKGISQYKNMSIQEFEQHRIKSSLQKGRTLDTFNGFTSPENARIRQSAEGKAWIYDVLSKANFTCVKCDQRGGSLHAHHKNSFNSFPDQRFIVENGACLCETCHSDFHSKFGKGNNTEEQFDEWIKNKR